jgi:glycosyltransferase involved in cell wall biosynthesis
VHSVATQTARDQVSEIVVVDDGSTDGSPELLARLAREIPVLRVIRTEGIGVSAARNTGIRLTSAPLVAFLDADDYWVPDKLARQLGPALDDARVGLVYSDFVDFSEPDSSDAQLVTVRRFDAGSADTLAEYFVHDAPIVPSTIVVRRVVFDDVGVFDETIRLGEDTEFFLRVAERWQFQHVPGAWAYKRRHDHNLTRRLDALLPINRQITETFSARHPALARLARARMSRRYARAGHDCARRGETAEALHYLGLALACAPLFWRPYGYLALMLVPRGLRDDVLRAGKRMYHGALRQSSMAVR